MNFIFHLVYIPLYAIIFYNKYNRKIKNVFNLKLKFKKFKKNLSDN
jgi:hypothetical protein